MVSENLENSAELVNPNAQATSVTTDNQSLASELTQESEETTQALAEEKDYSQFTKQELIAISRELLANENLVRAEAELKKIKLEIDRITADEKEIARKRYLVDNGNEDGFEFKNDKDTHNFYEILKEVREQKKRHFNDIKKDRENNLKEKRAIIDQLKEMLENSDQKGSFGKVKELQQRFRQTGPVPSEAAEDVYETYKALVDKFYDLKSIENELKDLDRKKNLQDKIAICDRAEKLLDLENVNDAVNQLNLLSKDFREIGPAPKEKQDEIWQRFKDISDKLYEKKRIVVDGFKAQLRQNMQQKQELCLAIEPFATFESDRIKEWNEKTKEVLDIQEKWEQIGALPKEVAKDINKQFWANFKQFFNNKTLFFEKIEAFRNENLKQKEDFCLQAEALKDSENWEDAAEKIKELQNQWRQVGPVPEKYKNSIYDRFKAACDYFFERKRTQKVEKDNEFVVNLKKKEAVCLKIEEAIKTQSFDQEQLNAWKEEYTAIGFVPKNDINAILDRFMKATENYFQNSPLKGEEKEKQKLAFQADMLKTTPGSGKRFDKQEQQLVARITRIENDIALWQNNLMFFAKSKTADKLRDEFNSKIAQAQSELKELREQLKIVRSVTRA